MKERQRLERKKLKKSRQISPTFEDWLKLQENEALSREFQYKQDTPILTADDNTSQKPERIIPDIRDYKAKILGNRVAWFKSATPEKIDFIDHGKSIVISNDYDESTVLAVMQLAVQKWGKVTIHGNDERYRQLCVKVAAEHNYTLSNKDLAIQVEERKKQIRAQYTAEHGKAKASVQSEQEHHEQGQDMATQLDEKDTVPTSAAATSQASISEVRAPDSPKTTHDDPLKEGQSLWKRFTSKFKKTSASDNSTSSSAHTKNRLKSEVVLEFLFTLSFSRPLKQYHL